MACHAPATGSKWWRSGADRAVIRSSPRKRGLRLDSRFRENEG
jgi:hypothetical protein